MSGLDFSGDRDDFHADVVPAVAVMAAADELAFELLVGKCAVALKVDADELAGFDGSAAHEGESAVGDAVCDDGESFVFDVAIALEFEAVNACGAFDAEAFMEAASEAFFGRGFGGEGLGNGTVVFGMLHEFDPGVDDGWVVFGGGFVLKDLERLGEGFGAGFERPVGGHGVEGIHDGADAADEVHLFAIEGAGIAGGVHAFMMLEGDAEDEFGDVLVLGEMIDAELGMLAEEGPVIVGEGAAFVEDFFGDEDFADVVQDAGHAYFVELGGIANAEGVGEGDHPGADVDHVGGGVEVVL